MDLRRRRDERKPRKPAGTLLGYSGWLLKTSSPENTGSKTGGDKLMLMTILDAGGSITPVETALRTSLTVDEAEQILPDSQTAAIS